MLMDFNPHEREARDCKVFEVRVAPSILIHTSVKLVTRHHGEGHTLFSHFNPHEREARDLKALPEAFSHNILIHTSVKLVTFRYLVVFKAEHILIHTSVKLVTLRAITNANILTF